MRLRDGFQIGDEQPALVGIIDLDVHPAARRHLLRSAEPLVETRRRPHSAELLERRRIVEAGNARDLASDDVAVPRSDAVRVDGMAAGALPW